MEDDKAKLRSAPSGGGSPHAPVRPRAEHGDEGACLTFDDPCLKLRRGGGGTGDSHCQRGRMWDYWRSAGRGGRDGRVPWGPLGAGIGIL